MRRLTPLPIGWARPQDVPACAAIKNVRVDATAWLPRVHPVEDVVRHDRETVVSQRKVFVAGEHTVADHLAQDGAEAIGFLVATGIRGGGVEAAVPTHAKTGRVRLAPWISDASDDARRFHSQHGFRDARRKVSETKGWLADVLPAWERER